MSGNEIDDIYSSSDVESDFVTPRVLKTFDVGIDIVTSIAFQSLKGTCPKNIFGEDSAFIYVNKSTSLPVYDGQKGDALSMNVRVPLRCSNDICTFQDNFYMCGVGMMDNINAYYVCRIDGEVCHDTDYFWMISRGEIECILCPTGLCLLNDGSIAVCMVEKQSYAMDKQSCRKVCIYTQRHFDSNYYRLCMFKRDHPEYYRDSDDKLVLPMEIEFNGKNRLFVYPRRIAQSAPGDLWVVNRLNEHAGNIIVTDINGGYKFTYSRCSQNTSFDPKDIATNKNESMIIADYRNHLVHLVKDDGSFLQYIMTKDDGLSFPSAVALDPFDRAWIGCDFGKMHIVRFSKNF